MTTSLVTSLHTETDICFAATPGGELFMTNGIDRGRKWNGSVNSTPVYIGLDAPTTAATVGTSGSGGSEAGDYICYVRFGDADGNYSNLSPVTEVTAAASKQFDWSSIPTASGTDSSARITKRELFRSLVGAFEVVYLVTTLNDNSTTTYSDTLTDEALADREELQLLNDDDSLNANRFGVPPTTKEVCIWNQDRMFYLVDAIYSTGTVTVTNGSATVTGSGTAFTKDFVGRMLYPLGGSTGLLISAYTSGTSITISANYSGTTLTGVAYEIRPAPGELNTVFFSEPDEPESVPQSQNKFTLQTNPNEDDRIVGGYSIEKTLYIAQEQHTFGFSYVRQPHLDGNAGLLFRRGLCNQRCSDVGGDVVFCMDQLGPYAVSGSGKQDIGRPIENYFRDGLVNRSASRRFFVKTDHDLKVVRFYVRLATDSSVKSAFCYDWIQDKWWLETYPWTVGAACNLKTSGVWKYYVGKADDRFCVETPAASADGISTGVHGTSSAISTPTISATSSIFVAGHVGCPLTFTSGAAKHSQCVIATVTNGTSVTVDSIPSGAVDGDTFVVGGVPWSWKSGILAYPPNNQTSNERSIAVVFKPSTDANAYLDIRHYLNHKTTAEAATRTMPEQDDGVSLTLDSADGTFSIYKDKDSNNETVGYVVKNFSGRSVDSGSVDRFVSAEVRGVAGGTPVEISDVEIVGAK
jgi:hypothetical protein